jgi:hypothetical protein
VRLSRLPILVLLVFVVVMTAYVYRLEHRPDADAAREAGADEIAILASVGLLHVGVGASLGRLAIPALCRGL